LAEKTLRPLNDGAVVAESTMSLNRFMETVYLPYAERQKRRSTFLAYRYMWKRYTKPDGDKALREFRTYECEQMLTSIGINHRSKERFEPQSVHVYLSVQMDRRTFVE
jgi:hypothetical protein